MTRRPTAVVSPVATATAVIASVVVLHAMGRGMLAAPPLTGPAAIESWLEHRDAFSITLAVVRVGLLALAYHLIATSLLGLAGRILRRPTLVAWADTWTLPMFRSTVGRLVGLGLSASTIVAGPIQGAGASGNRPAAEVVVQRISLDPPIADQPSEGAVLRRLPAVPAPTPSPAAEPVAAPAPTTHLVQPGDHLWSISEAALTARLGRPPTDAELGPYWATVVHANPHLVDPDLIYPGEAVNVPPPP